MDDLKNKLDQVKHEHAVEAVERDGREIEEKRIAETMFFLGRVKQIGHDARSVATALSAQEIRALEHFQEQKMFIPLGYSTFVDFLDKSEYSPMSKRQYYERRELMNAHGDEIYDLLTSVGISVRAQKMLGNGELSIEGDKLVAGDVQIDIANSGLIKQVLGEMFDDKRELEKKLATEQKKNADNQQVIDRGIRENEELTRNIDAMRSKNPHDMAVAVLISDALELTEAIGQLPDQRKAPLGQDTLPLLNTVMQRIRAAYGTNFTFTEAAIVGDDLLADIASQVNSLDDEQEDLD